MLSKYFMPTSLTWWSSIAMVLSGLVEIIAGRIAADLEREMLLTEGARTKGREKHLEAAARWQNELDAMSGDSAAAGEGG